jgi:putative tricarboxylic transport membrane protein
MDVLQSLGLGLLHVFTPQDFLMLVLGLVIGMAVSIMPGLGLVMGVALALPFTYRMPIEPAIILLTAIYVSGTYAGCFTAILYRIPGEPMDVPLLWDGYGMTQRGEAAKALGWALVAALTGGLISSAVMVALAVPFSEFALRFGPTEYFGAVFFGFTSIAALAGRSFVNALISLMIGLWIATIGVDQTYGAARFTFGSPVLMGGVPFVVVLVGMYGLGELLSRIGRGLPKIEKLPEESRVGTSFPSLREIWPIRTTFVRSSILGTILGIIPGAGATITSFISYGIEKQYGKRRAQLGKGVPEGIVAPQIGSTASVAGHMIPLLTLGLPGSGATAVILGAFLLHGVQPGPMLFTDPSSKIVVYSILASLFVGVVGMCVMGYLWIRIVVKVLMVPQPLLVAIVMVLCIIGAYAERNSMNDVWTIIVFGVLGFLFERFRFPIAPMVLGVILGPLAESSFVQSMVSYDNDWTVFFRHPISGTLLGLSIVALAYPLVRDLMARKSKAGGIVMAEAMAPGPERQA